MSLHVHHSHDKNRVATRLIDYSIRETIGSAAASPWRESGPSVWESHDSGQCTPDFGGELVPQALTLLVVVVDGLSKLGFSRFEDLDPHGLRGRSMLPMISSAEPAFSLPLS